MTLYGYSRDPDPVDAQDAPTAAAQEWISSQPVPVPVSLPTIAAPDDDAALPAEQSPASGHMEISEPEHAGSHPPIGYADLIADATQAGPSTAGSESSARRDSPDERDAARALDAVRPSDADSGWEAAGGWDAVGEWDDEDQAKADIAPWDRRPLMIVLAGAAALILLAVLSGVATVALFGSRTTPAGWRAPQAQPSATPTGIPGGPVGSADTITLSGVGDVIMGSVFHGLPPRGGEGFFDDVKSALAADLVMGNLETPLTSDTNYVKCDLITPPPGPGNPSPSPTKDPLCHQFYLPTSYSKPLRDAGFQVLNLANNHANDMGPAGLRNTRTALEAAGIRHTGGRGQITYVDVKGVRVAVLGFGFSPSGQNLNDIPAAEALVRKADAEADLVVIQMQGGAEGADKSHVRDVLERFAGEDRGNLVKFSHRVIDAGADVVFGHGPHIMRGMEFYKGRLIAYSLGNFCGYRTLSSAGYQGVGGVLKVTLTKYGTWAGGQLVPTEMVSGGLVAVDADKRALAFVHGLSSADFGANAASISGSDGTITPPRS